MFLTLTIVSPQYIFWSRTFMIESTALLFSMAYLYFIIRYIRTKKVVDAGLGGLCGVLGALVKVTTFPAFALVGSALYIHTVYREYVSTQRPKLRNLLLPHLVPTLCFACLPILVTSVWVRYTDQVRAFNLVCRLLLEKKKNKKKTNLDLTGIADLTYEVQLCDRAECGDPG